MTKTIIVGAGSGGGVAAARLTEESDQEVVLLEAGPFFASDEELPDTLRDALNPQLVDHGWGLEAYYVEPATERQPGPYPRGRLVGGSSAVNAAVGQRPSVEDFDAWTATGISGWTWEDVLPAFNRIERDVDFASDPYHGSDGPIPISRVGDSEWSPAVRAWRDAILARGYQACDDFNAPRSQGVGPTPRNQVGPLRASTLVTYLRLAQQRSNLTIQPETVVRRVLFDGRRATGVEVERDGSVEQIEGDRVVVAGGAVKTPQILILSGVGPADVVSGLGIPVVADLAGVGRNLQDHPIVPILALVKDTSEPRFGLLAELKYSTNGSGVPDMLVIPGMLAVDALNFPVETDAAAAIIVAPVLAKPYARGWVTVTSADPHAKPEIHLNYLADERDTRRLLDSTRFSYEVVTSPPMSDELAGVLFPDAETIQDDDACRTWLREVVDTCYHCSGTARLGRADDPDAVVDERLAVHGLENLYVADASVMPEITMGLTNLACYMIGERMAEFLS